jgi:phenylalanyl-tRNA synthetase beta chain
MLVPLSWLAEYADVGDLPARRVADALTDVGLEVERVRSVGAALSQVVAARVLRITELAGFKKPIRYCELDDGGSGSGVVCGATNFATGDLVALARPGATLPGGVVIQARTAYGHRSDGMICSARELGISEEHSGILVLPPGTEPGRDVVEVLGLAEEVLDIAVTADRGYCWSVRGVAREAAGALGVAFADPAQLPVPKLAAGGYPASVQDYLGCDRFLLRRLDGIDPKAVTPGRIARRIALAGMRPISLVVDVTNYVMLGLGQPLHGYDAARLSGQVVVRRAGATEDLVTLDGVRRKLDPEDLLIADGSGPIGLAGVMGGAGTQTGPETTAVVIEAAHFDPVSVARTARRHRLSSEASRRFERGVDDALAPAAAQLAVALLGEHAGARAEPAATDIDARAARPAINLSAGLPGRIAGIDYSAATVRSRLTQVGAQVAGEAELKVTPPSWRPDLLAAVDLVEEVIRLEGYAQLPSRLPRAPGGRGLTVEQRRRRAAARSLAAAGYVEVRSLPFLTAESADRLGLPADDRRRPDVAVRNPLAEQAALLRGCLLPGLFEIVIRNLSRGTADLSVFEIGRVFHGRPDAAGAPSPPTHRRPAPATLAALDAALPDQPFHIGLVSCGERERSGWWGPGRAACWADPVSAARAVAEALAAPLEVRAGQAAPFHPGRCAELLAGGRPIGWAGQIHPRVCEAFALPAGTVAAEFSFAPLAAASADPLDAPAITGFPAATLDLAVVVDDAVPAGQVATALREGGGPLLQTVRLFDVYTGAQLAAGRKSLAFRLLLRAPDRTLSTEEALSVRDAALARAAETVGAVLRT